MLSGMLNHYDPFAHEMTYTYFMSQLVGYLCLLFVLWVCVVCFMQMLFLPHALANSNGDVNKRYDMLYEPFKTDSCSKLSYNVVFILRRVLSC